MTDSTSLHPEQVIRRIRSMVHFMAHGKPFMHICGEIITDMVHCTLIGHRQLHHSESVRDGVQSRMTEWLQEEIPSYLSNDENEDVFFQRLLFHARDCTIEVLKEQVPDFDEHTL